MEQEKIITESTKSCKLLVVIPAYMPSVKIILKEIQFQCLASESIEVIKESQLSLAKLLKYKQRILFVRNVSPKLTYVLKLLKELNIKYAYYLDDNLWEIPSEQPIAHYHKKPLVRKNLINFVVNASYVICGSKGLAEYVSKYNNKVVVLTSSFDTRLVSDLTYNKSKQITKICYVGSAARDKDFETVIPALIKIANEYQDSVNLYFFGYVPKVLETMKNVYFDKNYYEYDSFMRKQYSLGFDIGLAPLAASKFNKAKTNIKYREYSACNIAGIYSKISPYIDCVTNNENGILVENSEADWYMAIKRLIDEQPLRETIIKNAAKDFKKNYTLAKVANKWRKYLSDLSVNEVRNITVTMSLKFFISFYFGTIRETLYLFHSYLKALGFRETMDKAYRKLCHKQPQLTNT